MVMRPVAIAIGLSVLALADPAWASCDHMLPKPNEASGPIRPVTSADLIELRDIGSPESWAYPGVSPLALSPDRGSIAFVINQAEIASNSYCRALVVMPANGGAPRVVDSGGEYIIIADTVRGLISPVGGGAMVVPAWSPDGRRIGYLKRLAGKTQVWEANADGSGARPVTAAASDISAWAWLDDRTIIVATRPAVVEVERGVDEEALSGWRYDDRIMTMEGLRPQLRDRDVPASSFAVDVATGRVRRSTASEDIILAAQPTLTARVEAGVLANDGRRAGIAGSPTNPQVPRRIWVSDAGGKRESCASDACSAGVTQLWWDDQGRLVFLRREGRGSSEFAFYRWRPGDGEPRRFYSGSEWVHACLLDGHRIVCTVETSSRPGRIVAIDLATGRESTLFDPNPGWARIALGRVERIFTRNQSGLDAWVDLVLPPDYKAGDRLPLVVVQYHSRGFLRGGTGNDYPIFLLARAGFAVLSFQRPPFYGLGQPELDTWDKLQTAGTKDWTERKSILSSLSNGIDQIEARGMIDPKRIGISGLSDGLSTIEYALINTKRFSAAALSTCCEDQKTVMTYGGTVWADWNHSVQGYPLAGDDGSAFWKPMSLALNARTIEAPILMQLADREFLGSLETFTALREQGKPVDLYVFPDEYHMKWQPRHRLAVYERSVDWFDFWLNGRERGGAGKEAQYRLWRGLRASALASKPSG